MMNLDFCFMDDARIVAVAGWTTSARPDLRLHVDDEVLTPVLIARHVRRDLRSSEPLGAIALFDLAALGDTFDAGSATVHLAEGQDFIEIRTPRLSEDAARLIQIGVDEVFFAVLRLIATRHLVLADESTGRDISARLRLSPSAGSETENHILAIDRCQASTTGQGAVIGWYMPAGHAPEALCALAFADDMVVPVDLFPGVMARADLAPYAPRYRFTGRDGYGGGWRFPAAPTGPVRVLLMVPGEYVLPGIFATAHPTGAADLAQQVATASLGMDSTADRDRLRRALLPASLPDPQPLEAPDTFTDPGTDTLLILDHDLADHDLRDVLRRIGPHIPASLRLHLLRPCLTPALQNGIDGAQREVPGDLRLEGVSLDIPQPDQLPARVVFARSGTLFQFDAAQLFAASPTKPRLMLLDPIGAVMPDAQASADRFARDLLPFALSIEAAAFFGHLAQIPDCFLTQEARIRILAERLMAQDRAELSRADIFRYFEGKSGPHSQSLTEGTDWHAHDAESRRLIRKDAA